MKEKITLIIGVLIAFLVLAIPVMVYKYRTEQKLTERRAPARDARRVKDMKRMRVLLEMYFAEHVGYPVGEKIVLGRKPSLAFSPNTGFVLEPEDGVEYSEILPSNPEPGGMPYTYTSLNEDWSFCSTDPCKSYMVEFEFEDNKAYEQTTTFQAGKHVLHGNDLKIKPMEFRL